VQEHERGLGGWQAEWETLPEICTLTLGAVEKLCAMLAGLVVNSETMQDNLGRTGGLLLAEAVSMAVAGKIGRDRAHALVEHASQRAVTSRISLHEAIEQDDELMQHLSQAQLDRLLNPALYTGDAQKMIDRVLGLYAADKAARKMDGM
jgi:3-carboxy-cis,cis-muconate cycloisomerase